MSEKILINVTPFETRVAIVENGILQEIHQERNNQRGKVNNIYYGRVTRVLPGMQSAFIDIGLEKAAFIHVSDLRENRQARQNGESQILIERILFEGQTLLVQVIKDAINNKGARVSTQITIAGRVLVYLPYEQHIGISQKIESEIERETLRTRIIQLMDPDETGGYIVRTQGEWATDEEIQNDHKYLTLRWKNLKEELVRSAAPALLYEDLDLTLRVLRDIVNENTEEILIDSRTGAETMQTWASHYSPALAEKIYFYTGSRPIFDNDNVENDLAAALQRRVELKSGGYLMIDKTEALTSVDVNTGGFVGWKNFHETVFRTNLEAAQTIARQLRIRNIGGIIVIDFIDMKNKDQQNQVLEELRKALSKDRTRTTVNDFSALGLVEMTRKRTRDSLGALLSEPCLTCHSRGYVLTARSVCYNIMREILREAKQFNPNGFKLIVSPMVIDLLLDEERNYLAMLDEFIGKPISLEVDNNYSQEDYDIILI